MKDRGSAQSAATFRSPYAITARNSFNRGGDPVKVNEILTKALGRHGVDKQLDRYKFVLQWSAIVGEEIAKRSKPECFRGKTLIVRVINSVWANELSFQKDTIIARFKKVCGAAQAPEDIQFCVGVI